MKTIRAAELEGTSLDYWVATAAGKTVTQGAHPFHCGEHAYFLADGTHYNPSAGGADAAALMARAGITAMQLFDDQWAAQAPNGQPYYGETEHIAAMRAYVGKVLGEEWSAPVDSIDQRLMPVAAFPALPLKVERELA